MTLSGLASPAESRPATRHSLITTTRWDIRNISGSSDEIMMIDLPLLRELVQEPVDFVLCPDVDAARRFIKDQMSQSLTSHLR